MIYRWFGFTKRSGMNMSLMLRKLTFNKSNPLYKKFSVISSNTLDLANGIINGSRSSLARAITLIESSKEEHQVQSGLLLDFLASAKIKKKNFQLGINVFLSFNNIL